MSGPLDEKRKAQEEDYFRKQDQQAAQRLKFKKALESAGVTDEELKKTLLEAGYDDDSARALYLVPVIDVAWADGRLDPEEIATFKKILKTRGIEESSKAFQLATVWLEKGVDNPQYQTAKKLFDPFLVQLKKGGKTDNTWILEAADLVASATGGLFGFGNKTSSEEDSLLKDLASKL